MQNIWNTNKNDEIKTGSVSAGENSKTYEIFSFSEGVFQ